VPADQRDWRSDDWIRAATTAPPDRYAFWKNAAKVCMVPADLREAMLDVAGQETTTADKVTLRLNAVVTYRVSVSAMFSQLPCLGV